MRIMSVNCGHSDKNIFFFYMNCREGLLGTFKQKINFNLFNLSSWRYTLTVYCSTCKMSPRDLVHFVNLFWKTETSTSWRHPNSTLINMYIYMIITLKNKLCSKHVLCSAYTTIMYQRLENYSDDGNRWYFFRWFLWIGVSNAHTVIIPFIVTLCTTLDV